MPGPAAAKRERPGQPAPGRPGRGDAAAALRVPHRAARAGSPPAWSSSPVNASGRSVAGLLWDTCGRARAMEVAMTTEPRPTQPDQPEPRRTRARTVKPGRLPVSEFAFDRAGAA